MYHYMYASSLNSHVKETGAMNTLMLAMNNTSSNLFFVMCTPFEALKGSEYYYYPFVRAGPLEG